MADRGAGEGARDERAGVAGSGDVAPAEEPATVPAVIDFPLDLWLLHPIAGQRLLLGVPVLGVREALDLLRDDPLVEPLDWLAAETAIG